MAKIKSHHKKQTEMVFSPAQRKLATSLKKRYSSLTNDDMPELFDGIKRFVKVAQKINSEPQAKIFIKEWTKNKKRHKQRIIKTTIEEFAKVTKGKAMPIKQAFEEINKIYEPKRK